MRFIRLLLRPGWPWGAWALLVGVALALRPILPIDETRYVSVAWEMWLRGDLLVPHLNGQPYSDKPPLLFWLFHLGWWLFGVNEWWPRLVPPLFGLANLFLARSLARRLWPDRPEVARTVPAVLLGFFFWSLFTTFMMFDMLVACAVLLALHGLWSAREGGWRGWLLAGSALGLGILAKGPVALVLPTGVALLAPWWASRRPGGRWWAGLLAAVAVAAAVGLAWALPAAHAGGQDYAHALLLRQTEGRIVDAEAHGRPWWWYLPLLPVLLFPYSVWAPAWKAASRWRPRTGDEGTRFCLAWLLPGLAVFFSISSKQPHYLTPLLPAFALLLSRLTGEMAPAVRRWHLVPPLAGLALVGMALAAAPLLAGRPGLPPWLDTVPPGIGLVLLILAAVSWSAWERLFVDHPPAALALVSLTLVTGLHLGFSGIARQAYDLEPIARHVAVLQRQGRPIAFVGPYHGQLHFLGRLERPFEVLAPGAERLWAERHPRGKVIQDMDYTPPDLQRADFTQPYRDDVLAVWGKESLPLPVPSG